MVRTLSQCLLAAQKAAKTPDPADRADLKENYNYKTKKFKNYNYKQPNRYSGKALYKLINDDPVFRQGLAWGMSGGLLFNLAQEFGVSCVQESIRFVSRLPEAKRNGRYCRVVVMNGGPKGSQLQRSQAVT
ncbi:MAG: hypothetical protein KC476_00200 [Cyanobacteria bacterium HKST-UBA06]|nr:hypothetical protein [Cyanobacteria bacterium HKST-UBA06]